MGLAIVYSIIESYKGIIEVKSEKNKGLLYYFVFLQFLWVKTVKGKSSMLQIGDLQLFHNLKKSCGCIVLQVKRE